VVGILGIVRDLVEGLWLRTVLLTTVARIDVLRLLPILGQLGSDRIELLGHQHARVAKKLEFRADARDGAIDLRCVWHLGFLNLNYRLGKLGGRFTDSTWLERSG
jgi:hypothetical protein